MASEHQPQTIRESMRPELLQALETSAALTDKQQQAVLASAQVDAHLRAFKDFVHEADGPTDQEFLIAGLGEDPSLYDIDLRCPEARAQLVEAAGHHIARLHLVQSALTKDTPVLQVQSEFRSRVGKETLYRRWGYSTFGVVATNGLITNEPRGIAKARLTSRFDQCDTVKLTAREVCYYTALDSDETEKLFTQSVPGSETANAATYIGESAISAYLGLIAQEGSQHFDQLFVSELVSTLADTLTAQDKPLAAERINALTTELLSTGIILQA